MTAYAFDTITPDQALAIQATDVVTFSGGSGRTASVAYNIPIVGPATITVTFAGHAVEFGMGLLEVSERSGLVFDDHSRLLIGGTDRDNLLGWVNNDGLFGGQGDDILVGQGGDDLLQGNAGNDRLFTEVGADVVYGGQGDDVIRTGKDIAGEAGDFANGNAGNDTVSGGSGADTLLGGRDNDKVTGGDGADYISGDLGKDELHGGAGDDTIFGGAGDDTIYSEGGKDVISGGDGADLIIVSRGGGTTVDGGDGDDTILVGSPGKNVLLGGAGADRFEFVVTDHPTAGQDNEIHDWSSADHLAFDQASVYSPTADNYAELNAADYASAHAVANALIAGGKIDYVAAQVGGNVVVFADTNGDSADGADTAVVLTGRTLADIDWWSFV